MGLNYWNYYYGLFVRKCSFFCFSLSAVHIKVNLLFPLVSVSLVSSLVPLSLAVLSRVTHHVVSSLNFLRRLHHIGHFRLCIISNSVLARCIVIYLIISINAISSLFCSTFFISQFLMLYIITEVNSSCLRTLCSVHLPSVIHHFGHSFSNRFKSFTFHPFLLITF